MIRAAVAEDAVPCARILGAFFDSTPWLPRLHTPAEDLAFMQVPIARGQVRVVAPAGIATGFIARNGDAVTHLYLDPAARGQGWGGQLLQEAQGVRDRLTLWCFQANTGARRFYERHGFVPGRMTDGADNEEGVPDVQYIWEAAT